MNHYIVINGQRIELTEDQVKQIIEAQGAAQVKLADMPAGGIAKIGGYEFIVLEQLGESTAVICKDLIGENSQFGESNNYDGSYVDDICCSFTEALEVEIGEDNILPHAVDLTSDDGLKDYGTIERRVSLLTADLYRKYVEVLDMFKPGKWWWLATPWSTERHDNDLWVLCVSPSGCISYDRYDIDYFGVRPFCFLKSDIFVSK